MIMQVFIGFDSAWTDNVKNPGAISACIIRDGSYTDFHPPRLATFAEATGFIKEVSSSADYTLIAIDQPTIVPNLTSLRPVDRVAASLISSLKGGVQPARRGGSGAPMFGDAAPIWPFLAAIDAVQNPMQARTARAGRYALEVFPALALPALVPAIMTRRRSAKYNPAVRRRFLIGDWSMVASGVAGVARTLGASDLASWLDAEALRTGLRKADQDRLDAAVCLTIALAWKRMPPDRLLQVGDEVTGYMATVVSPDTRAVLVKAAEKVGVHVDRIWS